jgi:ABC-2 type transport system ATP-binding protein
MGKTIIVSSHILPELADTCNKVGIIDRGVMSVNASVAEVMKQVRQHVVLLIAVRDDLEAAGKLVQQHELVDAVDVQQGRLRVTLQKDAGDYSGLATLLVQHGHRLTTFCEEELNLESAFMALTKGMGNAASQPPQ